LVFVNLREMTWWVWEREMMHAAVETTVASDVGCKKGVLWGLKRGCSPAMAEEKPDGEAAEESRGVAAGEEVCTVGEECWTASVVEEKDVFGGFSIEGETVGKVF